MKPLIKLAMVTFIVLGLATSTLGQEVSRITATCTGETTGVEYQKELQISKHPKPNYYFDPQFSFLVTDYANGALVTAVAITTYPTYEMRLNLDGVVSVGGEHIIFNGHTSQDHVFALTMMAYANITDTQNFALKEVRRCQTNLVHALLYQIEKSGNQNLYLVIDSLRLRTDHIW